MMQRITKIDPYLDFDMANYFTDDCSFELISFIHRKSASWFPSPFSHFVQIVESSYIFLSVFVATATSAGCNGLLSKPLVNV